MKKIIIALCALLVITCSAVVADEEDKEHCFFIELESGEVIEICDEGADISLCGVSDPCGRNCR